MSKSKKARKLHPFEVVWYLLTGGVGVWGLVYWVLGLVCLVSDTTKKVDPLKQANAAFEKTFGLGFFYWGLIIIVIAIVAAVIVLLAFAKTSDRLLEKEQRRAARVSQLQKEQVIDAEVETK